MIVFLPGFGRGAAQLAAWRTLLPGPVEVLPLPSGKVEIDALADHYAATVPTDALVVGESFGGLIALALAGKGFRAVVVDPPLTTQKQWAVQYGVRTLLAASPSDHDLHALAAGLLGIMCDGKNEERIYYPLLDALTVPVDIVTGNVPLWPYRGDGLNRACCLDDVDRYIVSGHPLVTLHEIEGPHALLDASPEACLKIILGAQEHGQDQARTA
ncbi:MAG: hypothetical protein JWQ29_468 [Phenylobacterium sp.]|nr:hypothetical protein [Phenylobacterium sp.]